LSSKPTTNAVEVFNGRVEVTEGCAQEDRAIEPATATQNKCSFRRIVAVFPPIYQAQAVEGNPLRGTTAWGTPTHLVSLVQHGSGTTLAQDQVAQKRNDITAVPRLLAGRDLTDTVVTMDALRPQRARAPQIIDQGGH
jgi:hypothetical protein